MITHIMKDGTVKKDIKGHVVKVADAPSIYVLIETINTKEVKNDSDKNN